MKEIEKRIGRGGRTRPLHQKHIVLTEKKETRNLREKLEQDCGTNDVFLMGWK